MTYDLVASSRFRSDYLNAIEYMRSSSKSLQRIKKFRDSVNRAADLLREYPGMYQVSIKEGLVEKGLRECLFDDYRIIFRIDGMTVYLLRLLHQKQRVEDKV